MNFLIAGIKNWPVHHAWEHLMGEALQAAGHRVFFLGCAEGRLRGCECVDRAVRERAGSHAAFCRGCLDSQGGVHERAGFTELVLPAVTEPPGAAMADIDELLGSSVCGVTMQDLLRPSLHRWARSGRPLREAVPAEVVRDYATTVSHIRTELPRLLREREIETLLLLNGLFFAERAIGLTASSMGLRVVNYERGQARNTLVFSDGEPSCFMKIDRLLGDWERVLEEDPVAPPGRALSNFLAGRGSNRDAVTRFGTDEDFQRADHAVSTPPDRPLAAVFTNVCWDSSVSSRPSGFGGYLDWLDACIELARLRPGADFVIRIHPGEARLDYDPTLDRTADLLSERRLPANLRLVLPEDPESSYDLMRRASLGIVFVSSAGLEMACGGRPVIACAETHYAGKGFTEEAGSLEELAERFDSLLRANFDEQRCAALAGRYAERLFFDYPTPFPWVDEIEYGRPQRIAAPLSRESIAADPLLGELVDYLCGTSERPPSLRDLLDNPRKCPLPFYFSSRDCEPPGPIMVVIPTHGRPDQLLCTLEAYGRQTLPACRFEILVIDDGSPEPLSGMLPDDSAEEADHATGRPGLPSGERGRGPRWRGRLSAGVVERLRLRFIRLERNGGPAGARNRGLRELLSEGRREGFVLFTGDDIVPEPDFLESFERARRGWNDPRMALLGKVDWPAGAPPNRVMRLVQRNGMQFAYDSLPRRALLPAQFFYTCAAGLDLGFLADADLRFSEDFPYAAWEDAEFAVRAMEAGMLLAYDSSILARHHHPMDYGSFAARQRRAGASARVFHRLRPGEFTEICGTPPAEPPDRRILQHLENAMAELSKLDLPRLAGLPGAEGDLARQLDGEQDRLLETLFRMHHDAGWLSRPVIGQGEELPGLLSICIPVHNRAELTRACIEAIGEHTGGAWEVVLVDNGSTDETARIPAAYPRVRAIRCERNLGFARANNIAAEAARGELLVLLNNDTEVLPGWDRALREELDSEGTGICGLRLLYPDGTIQHAGVVFGRDGLPWHIHRGLPAEAPEVMYRRELNAVTGACLSIRRSLYRRLGGLNENFVNCYEDIDLCLRIRREGYRVVYRPDGAVIHHEGKTAGRGEGVDHSWLVLNENWAGEFPADEEVQLARDGLRILRDEDGSGRVVRVPGSDSGKGPSQARRPKTVEELRRESRELRDSGQVGRARELLELEISGRNGGAQDDDPALAEIVLLLLDLELAAGNLAAVERLAAAADPGEERRREIEDLRRRCRERLREYGIEELLEQRRSGENG